MNAAEWERVQGDIAFDACCRARRQGDAMEADHMQLVAEEHWDRASDLGWPKDLPPEQAPPSHPRAAVGREISQ